MNSQVLQILLLLVVAIVAAALVPYGWIIALVCVVAAIALLV